VVIGYALYIKDIQGVSTSGKKMENTPVLYFVV
jgi:hypothetical protein